MAGNNAAAGPTCTQRRRGPGAVFRALVMVLMLLSSVLMPFETLTAPAMAWSLPGLPAKAPQRPQSPTPLQPTAPAGRLQEQAPPVAVQQLQEALAERQPQVEIISPRDGALLGDGPWELHALVRDWPVVDAGRLGLGAHLVVQIDDQAPLRLSGDPSDLRVQAPALAPGSHRITVYAAKPWGEAVKSPGAIRQIRVQRVAANPLGLPAPGSPQLIPVSPTDAVASGPVLLDWILLDAPLQNLRPGDGSWRLRVSVNGDSFLLDQNVPIWLQGWRPGNNSLLLELVDGLGEPLNAPFNSRVLEVNLPRNSSAQTSPRWLQGRLNEQELGLLLGTISLAETEAQPAATEVDNVADQDAHDGAEAQADSADKNDSDNTSAAALVDAQGAQVETPPAAAPNSSEPRPEPPSSAAAAAVQPDAEASRATDLMDSPSASEPGIPASAEPAATAEPPAPQTAASLPPPAASAPASTPTQQPPERISSSTSLEGSARDLVNADGSLIKAKPAGPLAGLRQRLKQ